MNRKMVDYVITVIGAVLFVIGLFLTRSLENPIGFMQVLPYLCVGVGAGLFGHSQGNIISKKLYEKNQDAAEQFEIEKNDERNIAIANKAKSRAYDLMIYVYGAIMLAIALMGVDRVVVLILVAGYLIVVGYHIYFLSRYQREM